MEMNNHLEMLGLKATECVTGFSGTITTLSFDLYGCIQAVLTPAIDKDYNMPDGKWFDVTRLRITDSNPVMQVPNFNEGYIAQGKKGCAAKSLPS